VGGSGGGFTMVETLDLWESVRHRCSMFYGACEMRDARGRPAGVWAAGQEEKSVLNF
jgi:hypothetical protein